MLLARRLSPLSFQVKPGRTGLVLEWVTIPSWSTSLTIQRHESSWCCCFSLVLRGVFSVFSPFLPLQKSPPKSTYNCAPLSDMGRMCSVVRHESYVLRGQTWVVCAPWSDMGRMCSVVRHGSYVLRGQTWVVCAPRSDMGRMVAAASICVFFVVQ